MTDTPDDPHPYDPARNAVRAAKWDDVRVEMIRRGHLETENGNIPSSERQLLSRAKRRLLSSKKLVEMGGFIWRLKPVT